jgi:hypothetical protein
MLASFNRQPVDHFPVTAPYLMLLQSDHWTQITGQPSYTYYEWCLQQPEQHIQEYPRFERLLPFDIAQPNYWSSTRADRLHQRIVPGAGGDYFRVDDRDGSRRKLVLNLHEKDESAEWERVVFTEKDAAERIGILPAAEILARGDFDYTAAYAKAYGAERFVAGTVVSSFYGSSWFVGLKNRFTLIVDEPGLLHAVIERLTAQNIETIRAMKQAGCDMVFIDDATATKDMISRKMYDEFCLPYLRRQVDAAHELGLKAVLIYFGGIADRVENIVSTGADGLLMETSMKGFVNDLESIAAQVNDRLLLFGNLNPYEDVELASDDELAARLAAQIAIGKKYGRFVVSAGSPLTPNTSLARMQKFIQLAQELGKA